jgi:ATP-dependent Clp protease ATP-binding subunit ClpC
VDSLKEKAIALTYTPEVCRYIAEKSIGGKSGARDLRNNIRREIEDKIATEMVTKGEDAISGIAVSVVDGKIELQTL